MRKLSLKSPFTVMLGQSGQRDSHRIWEYEVKFELLTPAEEGSCMLASAKPQTPFPCFPYLIHRPLKRHSLQFTSQLLDQPG